jgi:putative tricarboxylic transport membrane protein
VSGDLPPAPAERGRDWVALAVALLLLALSGVVAYDAWSLPSGAATYARIGPTAFPYGIAVGLAALGLATAAAAFRSHPLAREPIDAIPVLWIVAGLAVQIALLPIVGFSLATAAVFAFTARAFGRGPLILTYAIGAVASLVIWLVFALALRLVLPGGPIEQAAQGALLAVVESVL